MKSLILLTLTFARVGPVLVTPRPAHAHAKVRCRPETGRRRADPIVFNRVPGPTGHLHTYLANRRLPKRNRPNFSTYADMVGKPTTCGLRKDSAAYWFPTLLRGGEPVRVLRFIAYYRSWKLKGLAGPSTGSGNIAYPRDARMIAGNMDAPGGGRHVTWNCNQASTRPGPYEDPIEAACHTARLAGSTGKVLLGAHVDFPTCWSGRSNDHAAAGNTADFSGSHDVDQQYAYPVRTSNGFVSCPNGFPHRVPWLRMTISWDYRGRGRNLKLSSGGFSMHADFWNTWVQSGLRQIIDRCINTSSAHPHGTRLCEG